MLNEFVDLGVGCLVTKASSPERTNESPPLYHDSAHLAVLAVGQSASLNASNLGGIHRKEEVPEPQRLGFGLQASEHWRGHPVLASRRVLMARPGAPPNKRTMTTSASFQPLASSSTSFSRASRCVLHILKSKVCLTLTFASINDQKKFRRQAKQHI